MTTRREDDAFYHYGQGAIKQRVLNKTDMNVQQKGLTLIELMTALAVAIVLLAVGIPAVKSMLANNRAVTNTNALVVALNLARSEAVKRNTNVTVCGVVDADVAAPACTGDSDWTGGWMVFTDAGTAGTVDGSDTRIRVWQPFDPAPAIDTGGANDVRFNPDGSSAAAVAIEIGQNGSLANQTRCVRILVSGQIRSERSACP